MFRLYKGCYFTTAADNSSRSEVPLNISEISADMTSANRTLVNKTKTTLR